MRVLVLARADITRNPEARALVRSLRSVGHDVTAVCGDAGTEALPDIALERVPVRRPSGWGRLGWLLRRIQPAKLRALLFDRALERVARSVDAHLIYPIGLQDLGLAATVATPEQAVMRKPHWPASGPRDIVDLAPKHVEYSSSAGGPPLPFHTPRDTRDGYVPAPGRHDGIRVAFVSHRTTTTPALYLESAAERAGMVVSRHDGRLDWSEVHPETAAVVFVESPYPAIEVAGANTDGVPTLFWVHHGEHHLAANLRLLEAYGAHAVLLAHSWHLAHRFPVPVHRFPFAVAPEIAARPQPFDQRVTDVAMIGAGVSGGGGRYSRRYDLVSALRRQFPTTSAFEYGVLPEEMCRLYADSKIVLNEGGDRHHPLTMRVFEATGAGAFLLTDPAPGLETLFPDDQYATVGADLASQAVALLADPATASRAAAAHRHAMQHHTYDHRIDELLAVAAHTQVFPSLPITVQSAMAALIGADPDVFDVAAFGYAGLETELATHVIWDGSDLLTRTPQRVVDAAVIGAEYAGEMALAAGRARRFVYAAATHRASLEEWAESRGGSAVEQFGGLLRLDLGADGYRLREPGHPLADQPLAGP